MTHPNALVSSQSSVVVQPDLALYICFDLSIQGRMEHP